MTALPRCPGTVKHSFSSRPVQVASASGISGFLLENGYNRIETERLRRQWLSGNCCTHRLPVGRLPRSIIREGKTEPHSVQRILRCEPEMARLPNSLFMGTGTQGFEPR